MMAPTSWASLGLALLFALSSDNALIFFTLDLICISQFFMMDTAQRTVKSELNVPLAWKWASLVFSQGFSVVLELSCPRVRLAVCCCYRYLQPGTAGRSSPSSVGCCCIALGVVVIFSALSLCPQLPADSVVLPRKGGLISCSCSFFSGKLTLLVAHVRPVAGILEKSPVIAEFLLVSEHDPVRRCISSPSDGFCSRNS